MLWLGEALARGTTLPQASIEHIEVKVNENDDVSHDKRLETIERQGCTVASHSWPTLADHELPPEHSPKTLQ